MSKSFPAVRQSELVISQLKNELLVYDLKANKSYCLNKTAAMIYELCDGSLSIFEIAQKLGKKLKQPVSEDFVWLALEQLDRKNLLSADNKIEISFKGLSRREVVRKVGLACLIALPVISSLAAPTAATAQSNCAASLQACTANNGLQSNCCSANDRCTNNGNGNACRPCLTQGTNTNCNTGAGCCTTTFAFFSNSCCNGVTETPVAGFPGTYSCACK